MILRSRCGSRRRIAPDVALWSLCVFLPTTVLAGQGPSSREADIVLAQEVSGPTYDPKTEATFTGTVDEIRGGPGRLGWLMRVHTFGVGHKGAEDRELLLETDTDTLLIHLGPATFLRDRKIEIKNGDRLSVTGSRVTIGDSQVVLAREIRRNDAAWTLRTATGQPLWSTPQPEARRFWTTTKIVLVVVAAKVALLATVLRH